MTPRRLEVRSALVAFVNLAGFFGYEAVDAFTWGSGMQDHPPPATPALALKWALMAAPILAVVLGVNLAWLQVVRKQGTVGDRFNLNGILLIFQLVWVAVIASDLARHPGWLA